MNELLKILRACFDSVGKGFIALAIGFVIFTLMERMFALTRSKKPWRATFLDLQYAVLSMLYPPMLYFLLSAFFGFMAMKFVQTPHNPRISPVMFAVELLVLLFVRDCLIYLRHRIFHLEVAWAFHSIHHSSGEVDWISALRFHPVENTIESALEILLFLGCDIAGMDPLVISVGTFIIGFYNLFIHSNLRWTYGPLRYVLVSPVYHRWHHSDRREAQDKNFAAMFSVIDLVFGTFYMPKDVMPETVGLAGAERAAHPRTLVGQLWYPFRKR